MPKRRTALLKRLDNCQRWGEKALRKARWNSKRYHRLYDQTKAFSDDRYRMLNLHASALAHTALVEDLQRRVIKDEQRLIDADLQQRWAEVQRCSKRSHVEWNKYEGYCCEQRQLLRDLETLNTQARSMFELDHTKDQLMTLCKLALANLVMWTRDHCFPSSYAHATTKRLLPFFRLPGRLLEFHDRLQVSLRPFNDRALNRDLATLCQRVNQAQLLLPSGKRLIFCIAESSRPTSVASP